MKHPSKHQRRSEKEIRALLSIQEKSGVPIIAFCKTYKIHKSTYYNWRNKYGAQIKTADKFVPVHFGRSDSEPALFGEIELASKVIVRLYQQVDATWIKSLLQ
jgi:hypothetical protein